MKMKHHVTTYLLALVLGIVFTGYGNLAAAEIMDSGCTNNHTNSMLKSGYTKKVDNFLILQDASSSMFENLEYLDGTRKLNYSKGLLNCLNNSLPDNFDVNGGLRGFGFVTADKGLVYGMTPYTNAGLADGIKAITNTGGVTPIAKAINYGSMDLKAVSGPTAVILFSDGLNTVDADPVAAAAAMKGMYPDICIYTVQIGDDPEGKIAMEQIADASKCGFAISGSAIEDAAGMDRFVTDVFLAEGMKAAAQEPPSAPAPQRPEKMISMTLLIEFDFDKDVVKPKYHDYIANVASDLKKYPGADTELEGHTDSMGSDAYNMPLSKRRAESVKRYLVEKFGISAGRITTVGYGESRPVATNDTAAGRQKNRRVVANIK